MSMIDRVLNDPELLERPPVLVDVGAAGGVHPPWRKIARFAIGVGFEPDARETAPLGAAQRQFRHWIYLPKLVVPSPAGEGRQIMYLTQSPQCSSTLKPRHDMLSDWVFADWFEVVETREFPATTLLHAITQQGFERIDWLKCDTQGCDLGIFQSLPSSWSDCLLALDLEPGLIDAYESEDKLAAVLAAMEKEPFWMSALKVGCTVRGKAGLYDEAFGIGWRRWVGRLAPAAPAWANVRYLRNVERTSYVLDRRALLLAWVFMTISGQHGEALQTANVGGQRFGGQLFPQMAVASRRKLAWSMVWNIPVWFFRRLGIG
jgi:hypothetical protein